MVTPSQIPPQNVSEMVNTIKELGPKIITLIGKIKNKIGELFNYNRQRKRVLRKLFSEIDLNDVLDNLFDFFNLGCYYDPLTVLCGTILTECEKLQEKDKYKRLKERIKEVFEIVEENILYLLSELNKMTNDEEIKLLLLKYSLQSLKIYFRLAESIINELKQDKIFLESLKRHSKEFLEACEHFENRIQNDILNRIELLKRDLKKHDIYEFLGINAFERYFNSFKATIKSAFNIMK